MKIYDRIRLLRKAYNMELHKQFQIRDRRDNPTISDLNRKYGLNALSADIRRSIKICKDLDKEIDYLNNKINENESTDGRTGQNIVVDIEERVLRAGILGVYDDGATD